MVGPPLAKQQMRNRGQETIELSLVELQFPSYRGALAETLGPRYLFGSYNWYQLVLSWHTYPDMKSIRSIFLYLSHNRS